LPERTDTEALKRHLQPLGRAISCVTDRILTARDFRRRHTDLVDVLLDEGRSVRLRGPGRIHLRVRLRVRLSRAEPPRGLWDATTAAYEYRLSDQDDREIMAYHWHPDGQSHIQAPHLHLGPGAEIGRAALLRAHLPTGTVPIQDVLGLAIETFEAEPARHDWDRVLRAAT
jgi:hypothetical protein